MTVQYWSKNEDADFEQFYNKLFTNEEYFSLSELDIKFDCHYSTSNGFNLALLHSKGYTHGDYHSGNLFFDPLTGSGNSCDPDTIKQCDLVPKLIFADFLPPYFSFDKEGFHSFLVGYFKSSVVIIDSISPNYSEDLLTLLGGQSEPLLTKSKDINSWYNYINFVEIEVNKSGDLLEYRISFENFYKINDEGRFLFFLFFKLIKLPITNIRDEDFFIKIFTEKIVKYFRHKNIIIELDVLALLISKWAVILEHNKVNSDSNIPSYSLLLELIEISNNLLAEKSIQLWEDIIILFDIFSKYVDNQKGQSHDTSSLLDLSVNFAQASHIILQKLSGFTNELHHIEKIELGIKKRQLNLSWLISPISPNWEGEPYQLPSIRLDEPAQRLVDELTKYKNSIENWQYNPNRFLKEFQYYNTLVITLNKLFNSSFLLFKESRCSNVLWTCAYRALSYARRNLFIIVRYILEEEITEKKDILSQVVVVCVSQLKYTLVNYWQQTEMYFGSENINNYLNTFSSSYEKLIAEMKSVLDFEAKIREDNMIIFQEEFRQDLIIIKDSIVRNNCFPF